QRAVSIGVATLQVVEQLAATAYHAKQATTRMVIFLVLFEVFGKFVDARGEQRHLNFGRTGIALGALVLPNDIGFIDVSYGHGSSPLHAAGPRCLAVKLKNWKQKSGAKRPDPEFYP